MPSPPLVKVPLLPKNLVPAECDRLFRLPPGVCEAWLRSGVVRPVWFVHRGMIVRGVRVAEVRPLVNYRRVRAVRGGRGVGSSPSGVGGGGGVSNVGRGRAARS